MQLTHERPGGRKMRTYSPPYSIRSLHLRENALVSRGGVHPVGSLAHRRQPVGRRHAVQVLAATAGAAAARLPAVHPVRLEVPRVVAGLRLDCDASAQAPC